MTLGNWPTPLEVIDNKARAKRSVCVCPGFNPKPWGWGISYWRLPNEAASFLRETDEAAGFWLYFSRSLPSPSPYRSSGIP